ncbi:hypothetical protein ACJX0J_019976, partial [Zea mays]
TSTHPNTLIVANEVILILDKSKTREKNIKIHIAKLLKYIERWVVLGDECTMFIHATATNMALAYMGMKKKPQ